MPPANVENFYPLLGPIVGLLVQLAIVRPKQLGMLLRQQTLFVTKKLNISVYTLDSYERDGTPVNRFILNSFYHDLRTLQLVRNIAQPILTLLAAALILIGIAGWWAMVPTIFITVFALTLKTSIENAIKL